MTLTTAAFPLEIRSASPVGAGPVPAHPRIRIMTGQRARDGDIVDPLGMDTTSYMRNPVVLWAHDRGSSFFGSGPSGGLPIARTLQLEPHEGGIDASFQFLAGDPFVDRIRNAWDQGFIRTASIGWITHASEPLPNIGAGSKPALPGCRHTRTELVEWSLVPVPADVGASRSGYAECMRSLGLQPFPPPEWNLEDLQLYRLAQAARDLGLVITPYGYRPDHSRPPSSPSP